MRILLQMFAMPAAVRPLVQQIVCSMGAAAFAFDFFLYGYCGQLRPRHAVPEMGWDHPFNVKGRLIYVSAFESLFLNGFFYWFAVLFIVAIISRSTAGGVLQYDIRRRKAVLAPPDERPNWRRIALLAGLWLVLLVAAWRVSL
jgi:hypothetical protein